MVLTFGLSVLFPTSGAVVKLEKIAREDSRLDVRIKGLDNDLLRYYYAGWNDDYTKERYIIYSRPGRPFARISILAND